ncbi:MAG: DUF5686 family protein [Breznakibacter sp.]
MSWIAGTCSLIVLQAWSAIGIQMKAQATVVEGRVIDATTSEPVAFANVYFKSAQVGTTTDFEGYYILETNSPTDSLTVSSVGYSEASKPIRKGERQTVHFSLMPASIDLSEVVIRPGENPAVTLLRKVWENKPRNNIDRLEQYAVDTYTKTQVYLRPFSEADTSRRRRNRVFNEYAIVAEENAGAALPVYMSETSSTNHYRRFPRREKVEVKASQTSSLVDTDAEIVTQLVQKSNRINFNDNHVRLLDRNFVSPLSTSGLFYYKYYLEDSLYLDGYYCYAIRVVPRRSEDLAFKGTIWVNDSTYALKRLSLEVGKNANLNFVDRIKVQQDLEPTGSVSWMPVKTRILTDAVNIFANVYVVNGQFRETDHPLGFYDTELLVPGGSSKIPAMAWYAIRPTQLDSLDIKTLEGIEALRRVPSARILAGLVNMSVKGYYNLGNVELGPYLMFYSHNEVEGHRFRLGARTNSGFSEKWIAKGYLAYGTTDRKVKYNAQLERFLSRDSWTRLGLLYSEDVERLGAMDEFYSKSTFSSFASSFGGTDKLNKVRIARAWLETDLFRGFTQKVVLMNKAYDPVSPDYHFAYYADEGRSRLSSSMTVTEVNFTSIYQPKATFIVDKNERFPVSFNNAPTFTAGYSFGGDGILGSDFTYHKALLGIEQNILLGSMGRIGYDLDLKKVFSPLPYPLLIIFHANESFFRTARTFNLMKYGEFVADESVELFVTFRQDGFILDRIPLVKKLQWRTVATASLAYGRFDEQKNGYYDPVANPTGILPRFMPDESSYASFRTFDAHKPYAEVSYGIENIFQLFRIEAIHRLSYFQADGNGQKPGKFAVKFSAVFRF